MDIVLITGTISGIGKAFAEKFASMRNNTILVSRNRSNLQENICQGGFHPKMKSPPVSWNLLLFFFIA